MRVNQPITNQERDYAESQKIVSTTDERGVITDVNSDFIDISGFNREELIGQAHNLVRHPSMPQAAFAELWTYNKQNKPWMGMVKNRCKNGDHYWVDAFVTPMYEKGKLVGYQSVRQKPSRELIDRAEAIYSGKQGLLGGFFGWLQKLPLSYKLFSGFSLISLLAMAMLMMSLPLFAVALVWLVGNAVVSMVVAAPWVRFARESAAIFESSIAQKVYTDRTDELGQIQLAMKFIRSQQETILYRTSSVSRRVVRSAESASESSDQTMDEIKSLYEELSQANQATENMFGTVKDVADNASVTSSAADESKANVDRGQQTLQNAKVAINDLVKAVDASSATIQNLSEDSSAIDSVVDVISGIAEQTNLLALNAAIEAARAGEQGRGFAVVADEVRSLAAKTQESTGQISEMISNLQNGANSAVSSIAASHEKVSVSVENINNLEEQFVTILENVNKISSMCVDIATSTEQQSSAANEITNNIGNINTVAQNTLESTEHAKVDNQKLVGTVSELNDMIKQFTQS